MRGAAAIVQISRTTRIVMFQDHYRSLRMIHANIAWSNYLSLLCASEFIFHLAFHFELNLSPYENTRDFDAPRLSLLLISRVDLSSTLEIRIYK